MPENAQRSWTLSVCPECGSAVVLTERWAVDAAWVCNSGEHGDRSVPRESVPVVEAVLTDALVEKVARAIDDEARGGLDGIRDEREDGLEGFAREALRAAGFRATGDEGGVE